MIESCFEAIDMILAFTEERQPFGDAPPPEVCVRLGLVPPHLMDWICTRRGLVIVRAEQRHFPDGDDTVYVLLSSQGAYAPSAALGAASGYRLRGTTSSSPTGGAG